MVAAGSHSTTRWEKLLSMVITCLLHTQWVVNSRPLIARHRPVRQSQLHLLITNNIKSVNLVVTKLGIQTHYHRIQLASTGIRCPQEHLNSTKAIIRTVARDWTTIITVEEQGHTSKHLIPRLQQVHSHLPAGLRWTFTDNPRDSLSNRIEAIMRMVCWPLMSGPSLACCSP